MDFIINTLSASWDLLLDAGIYIIFGIIVAGLLKTFMSPEYVARHLGTGRFLPVFKAALFGVPIPLCSCGVLPAAASLKKQGASNGATIAFLVSTPESGVDSISITYALLDPIMTIARPISAFISAIAAGITESIFNHTNTPQTSSLEPCQIDDCCNGENCSPEKHASHHRTSARIVGGIRYAFFDLWSDLALWFAFGILVSAIISVFVPQELLSKFLGGGFGSMIIMLAAGIPIYICASASTPIAASLILKGVSPGTALVFLLVGPATNMASLSVLTGLLGKKATFRYLLVLAITSVIAGMTVDQIYLLSDISAQAVIGQAGEIIPYPIKLTGALLIILFSIKPFWLAGRNLLNRFNRSSDEKGHGCDCAGKTCSN